MKEIEIIRLQGRGNGIVVKGCKSKREREYVVEKILKASVSYRKLYRLRNCM